MANQAVIPPPWRKASRYPAQYRAPLGIPMRPESRWDGAVSVIVHALLLLFIIAPLFRHDVMLALQRGAGGPGPAGGGGGGHRGAGGVPQRERLQFFALKPAAPPPPAPLLAPQPVKPVPPPPEPRPPIAPKVTPKIEIPPPSIELAPIVGTTGGTGADGTSGTGPGTGGGTGTGVGTGKGSATGPGTGGDGGAVYPATPEALILPPLPAPRSVRGKHVRVFFNLDEVGKVLSVQFEPTGDGSYDKELRKRCLEYRFRPAHKMDGTPVAWVYPFEFDL